MEALWIRNRISSKDNLNFKFSVFMFRFLEFKLILTLDKNLSTKKKQLWEWYLECTLIKRSFIDKNYFLLKSYKKNCIKHFKITFPNSSIFQKS